MIPFTLVYPPATSLKTLTLGPWPRVRVFTYKGGGSGQDTPGLPLQGTKQDCLEISNVSGIEYIE